MGVRLVRYNRPINGNGDSNTSQNFDHDELINRDLLNQHPIYAITGLQEILNILEDSIHDINERLTNQIEKDIAQIMVDLGGLDTRITDAENAIKKLQSLKYIDTESVSFNHDDSVPSLKANVRIWSPALVGTTSTNLLKCLSGGLYVPSMDRKDSESIHWDVTTKIATDSSYINEIIAKIKLSADSTNGLSIKSDGLYSEEFRLSKKAYNGISKESDGYWSEQFRISSRTDNSLEKLSDGTYYVRDYRNMRVVTQNNHGFVVGDFIYYRHDTRYQKALGIDSYDANIVGMVTKVINTNQFEYQWAGFFATDLFTTANGYVQGMPIYISDVDPGKVVQEQPDISKTVGYPVEDAGLIIVIERGIQYNQEATIGDFKTSANTYNVRSDGFIRIVENVDYKQNIVQKLIDTMSTEFKTNYMIIDDTNKVIRFKNIQQLYIDNGVKNGLNLFIKAF